MNPNHFCTDRDLLIIEPRVFLDASWNAQRLISGEAGALAGATWSDAQTGPLAAHGVQAGMVINIYADQVSEGVPCEVVSIQSNAMTISVPRVDPSGAAVGPVLSLAATHWQVLTFAPQIAIASATLAERLRRFSESTGIEQVSFVDSPQLRSTAAYLTLGNIFAAAAERSDDGDGRWSKSRHYLSLYRSALLNLRLACDVNGDGVAEQTRTLADVRLRRL